MLAYPDLQCPFIVDMDSNNTGLGAVLSREGENDEQAISYYSHSLSRADSNYCITRRELLGLRHF